MTNRALVGRLGLACLIYGAIFSAVGIWEVLSPSIANNPGDVQILNPTGWRVKLLLLAIPGFFAGKLGYYLSGAAGRNWFSKSVIILAALGHAMTASAELYGAATLRTARIFGFPLFSLGLLLGQWTSTFLLGVAAVISRRVSVWKRVWPIWVGIAPQVIFPLYIFVIGWPAFAALATNGLNWMVFGYVVWSLGELQKPSRS